MPAQRNQNTITGNVQRGDEASPKKPSQLHLSTISPTPSTLRPRFSASLNSPLSPPQQPDLFFDQKQSRSPGVAMPPASQNLQPSLSIHGLGSMIFPSDQPGDNLTSVPTSSSSPRRASNPKVTLTKSPSSTQRRRDLRNAEAFRQVDDIIEEGLSRSQGPSPPDQLDTLETGHLLTNSVSDDTLNNLMDHIDPAPRRRRRF